MRRIIYFSQDKIEWDAQSAFKLTNYYTDIENHMIFCYIRQYVQNKALKLCAYCFSKEATGKKDFELSLNLNPEKSDDYLHIRFGIEGIDSFEIVSPSTGTAKELSAAAVEYSAHKANDQQGHYWCGEITLPEGIIKELFNVELQEKNIILLNLYKIFEDSQDYASLFPDLENAKLKKATAMQEFVILKY